MSPKVSPICWQSFLHSLDFFIKPIKTISFNFYILVIFHNVHRPFIFYLEIQEFKVFLKSLPIFPHSNHHWGHDQTQFWSNVRLPYLQDHDRAWFRPNSGQMLYFHICKPFLPLFTNYYSIKSIRNTIRTCSTIPPCGRLSLEIVSKSSQKFKQKAKPYSFWRTKRPPIFSYSFVITLMSSNKPRHSKS